MLHKYKIDQNNLKYLYESAKVRMEAHPDYAVKHNNNIQQYPYFKTEDEVLEAANKVKNEVYPVYQIWAKIAKEGNDYRIQNWWILTNDWRIKQSAEYIGMAPMYSFS